MRRDVSIKQGGRQPANVRLKHRICKRLGLLRKDDRGVSYIELAFIMPILLTLGMYGTEVAYMAIVRLQVGQIAGSVADNASRLGQTDNSAVTPTVSENQIDSLMAGAMIQGSDFNFKKYGRVILSSLELDPTRQAQYIHWQRCEGDLDVTSTYGTEDPHFQRAPLQGMGSPDARVTATAGVPVMYVEIFYDYQPLFGSLFVDSPRFQREAAYLIRDDRNLVPGVTPGTGNPKSLCE